METARENFPNAGPASLPPRLTADLDLRAAARVVFLACLAGGVAVTAAAWALGVTSWLGYPLAIALASLLSLALNARGRHRVAVILLLLAMTACALTACLLNMGLNDVAVSFLPIVIVLAGLTLERRLLVYFTTLVGLGVVCISWARWSIRHTEPFSTSRVADLVMLLLTYVAAALIIERLAAFARTSLRMVGESEERFRATFEQAAVGIALLAVDGRYSRVNQKFCQIVGYSQEELLAKTFRDITHPDDLNAGLERVKRVLQAEIPNYCTEKRYVRKDGALIWVNLTVSLMPRQPGAPECFISVVEDISERKRAEAALRESESNYRTLIETTGTGYNILDSLGRVTAANQEYVRLSGHEGVEEILGRSVMEWTATEDLERNAIEVRKCLERGYIRDLEIDYVNKRGEITPVEINATVIGRGDSARILSLCRDISKRKRAAGLLRKTERWLSLVQESSQSGIWEWELQTGRSTWTDSMWQLFGLARGECEPGYDAWLQSMLPSDRKTVAARVKEAALQGKPLNAEWRVNTPGPERWLMSRAQPQLDEHGKVQRYVGIVFDVTEHKKAQAALFEKQKLASLGTLASGIAHDFNNLMAAVLSQAELVLTEIGAGSQHEEPLRAIQDVALRGSGIVRELMVYAGQEGAVLGPVDVSQVLDGMLGLLKLSVSKHASLEAELGKDLPAVWTNAAQVGQIVMNLVTNASEAIGERAGLIRVTTALVTAGGDLDGAMSMEPNGRDYVQLQVSDNGCGMSAETQSRVLDPFFSTKAAGHGLGLAVVHGIIRSLGGLIQLTSEPGVGTTIRVMLPCTVAPPLAACATTPLSDDPARTFQASVLVVEDEDSLRRPVSKLLRKAGLSVIETSDGSAALQVIRNPDTLIDVLLLDITLPGASSREVFEEARQLRPGMKVIVTSAYSAEFSAASLQANVEHFLRKPYRVGDLVTLVRGTVLQSAD